MAAYAPLIMWQRDSYLPSLTQNASGDEDLMMTSRGGGGGGGAADLPLLRELAAGGILVTEQHIQEAKLLKFEQVCVRA